MADFNLAVNKTLEKEGGYVNDPNDSGGETKYGISKRAFPNEDIKNLTIERAKELYNLHYWRLIEGDQIKDNLVATLIFDFAVNAGVKTAVILTQKALEATEDGLMGENTLRALNEADKDKFAAIFTNYKIARYVAICDKNPSQKIYFFGWVKRALEL